LGRINLEDIYHAASLEELREAYDGWADAYDDQLYGDYGHQGCKTFIKGARALLEPKAVLLDAGAGTGALGAALAAEGFATIDGIDMSDGMLAEARKKGVYRNLSIGVLGEPLDLADGAYDAVVSNGVFTVGHAPPDSFLELIRVTRTGGHVCFTMRDDERPQGYMEMIERLEDEGRWRRAHVGEPEVTLATGDPRYRQRFWSFEVA